MSKRDTVIYVSGPYSGDVETHIQKARKLAIELWERGYTVICPHLNTALMEDDCNLEYHEYVEGDLELVKRCDGIVMMEDWKQSNGAISEYMQATSHGLDIFFAPHDLPKRFREDRRVEEVAA